MVAKDWGVENATKISLCSIAQLYFDRLDYVKLGCFSTLIPASLYLLAAICMSAV